MSPGKREGVINVMLVDDHQLVRRGFRRLLEDEPGIAVVGEAGDGQEAIDLAAGMRPDVVVMDYSLPTMNGADATRRILASVPETAVLILSMHEEAACVRSCLDAGASGYLLKNAMDLELVQAVKTVAGGGTVLDPRLKDAGGAPERSAAGLSARELQVLQLIVDGKSNRDIALILNISANTVAVHRANVMQALDIHNTAELVVYAIRNRLVTIA
jgi:DNA-binding NarL/FixJ family response regulator